MTTDPGLAERIRQANEVSRALADLEKKEPPAPSSEMLESTEADRWTGEFKTSRKTYLDATAPLKDHIGQKILDFLQSVPMSQSRRREEILEQYNNFQRSHGAAVPIYPELRSAGLAYVEKSLPLVQQYRTKLLQLTARPPKRVASHDLETAKVELAKVEKIIVTLESVQSLFNALPTNSASSESPRPNLSTVEPKAAETRLSDTPEAPKPISSRWRVSPDPGPSWGRLPNELPYTELTGIHPTLIIYPPGPPRVFLAGVRTSGAEYGGDFQNVLVGQLSTGKPFGKVIRNLRIRNSLSHVYELPAVSSDGERIAYPNGRPGITVTEVRTGNKVREFGCKLGSNSVAYFPKREHLLLLEFGMTVQGTVWNLENGNRVSSFELTEFEGKSGSLAISPGGRYLAVARSVQEATPDTITFVDLKTGQEAGEIVFSRIGNQLPPAITALAFSPDGKELAAFGGAPSRRNLFALEPTLFIWDLATGRETERIPIETGNRGAIHLATSRDPLQWFPDHRGFLILQKLVIERGTGKLVDEVPAAGDVHAEFATKVLDDHRVLVAAPGSKLVIRKVTRQPKR
jgi:hypothetical protein